MPARSAFLSHVLRPLAVLLLAALFPFTVLAQATATIRVAVFTMEGKPVAGATVTAGGTTATTDKGGLASLKVKPGTYDVVASHPKFASDTQKGVSVKGTKDVSAVLLPK